MPKCWFVLLRFWLRVDDTILKIRETRYYCEEGDSATVWRETKHVEGTFKELAKGGAPSSNVCSNMLVFLGSLRRPNVWAAAYEGMVLAVSFRRLLLQ